LPPSASNSPNPPIQSQPTQNLPPVSQDADSPVNALQRQFRTSSSTLQEYIKQHYPLKTKPSTIHQISHHGFLQRQHGPPALPLPAATASDPATAAATNSLLHFPLLLPAAAYFPDAAPLPNQQPPYPNLSSFSLGLGLNNLQPHGDPRYSTSTVLQQQQHGDPSFINSSTGFPLRASDPLHFVTDLSSYNQNTSLPQQQQPLQDFILYPQQQQQQQQYHHPQQQLDQQQPFPAAAQDFRQSSFTDATALQSLYLQKILQENQLAASLLQQQQPTASTSSMSSTSPQTPETVPMAAVGAGKAELDLDIAIAAFINDTFASDAFTLPSALADIKTDDLPGPGQARKLSPTVSHANAFAAYRKDSSSSMQSPSSPFGIHDSEDDTVPFDTPALVADDGHDLSGLTSPMWGNIDLNQFTLFPDVSTSASAPVFDTASSGREAASLPVTVSPQELSLPLPFNNNSEPFSFSANASPPAPAQLIAPPLNQNKKRPASPPLVCTDSTSTADDSPAPPKKRRQESVSFTGSRNTSLPFVPLDAPTQTRTYVGPPSKTTKRVIPAAAVRKVAAIVTHHQEYTAEPSTSTSMEQLQEEVMKTIEDKRRQNTVAARRSRMRKAEHLQNMEDLVATLRARVEELESEKDIWMRRALDQGWKA